MELRKSIVEKQNSKILSKTKISEIIWQIYRRDVKENFSFASNFHALREVKKAADGAISKKKWKFLDNLEFLKCELKMKRLCIY